MSSFTVPAAARRLAGLLVFALVLNLLASCGRGRAPDSAPPGGEPPGIGTEPGDGSGAEPGESPPTSSVPAWLEYLTLEEKLGQLFWVGLPGTELTEEIRQLLAGGKVGGVIFFGRQGSDPDVLRGLTEALQAAAAARDRATPGLVIAVDHEGGLVQRFGPPFTQWPGAMTLGAAGSAAYAEAMGRAMARELRAVGVNMNLAPVADVNNNPENPVIGTRSFGEAPERVAQLVAAVTAGLQAEGVSAVAKHFPGHGDTAVDSHLDLPVIPHGRERLDRVELVPFRAAIDADVDAVMVAHLVFPAVAKDGRPGSLSPDVVTGLLKEALGFGGVAMTDALNGMAAITEHYGVDEGLVLAVEAGDDVVMVTESFGEQQALYERLLQAVREGRIPESRINDAAGRVLALKEKRGLLPPLPGEAGSGGAAGDPPPGAGGDPAQIGAPAHQSLADEIGAAALTLVRNAHLPLSLSPEARVLVIGPGYARRLEGEDGIVTALGAGIREMHANTVEVALDWSPDPAAVEHARSLAEGAAVVVYAVADGHEAPAHRALMAELIAAGKPVIAVGLGMPYELTEVPEIQTYIAAYGFRDANLKGIGPLLFGRAPARGRLPVAIPGHYPVGHGLELP